MLIFVFNVVYNNQWFVGKCPASAERVAVIVEAEWLRLYGDGANATHTRSLSHAPTFTQYWLSRFDINEKQLHITFCFFICIKTMPSIFSG